MVAGWGSALEAVVRRCLFAHLPDMIHTPALLLEARGLIHALLL